MSNIEININLSELTDEQLMLEFQNTDNKKAFDLLTFRYKDKLKNFLFRYTGDMAQAEDLCQDTFLKVYIKKDSYKEIAKFSTWMYTIGSNLAKTELRKYKRRKTYNVSGLGKEDQEFVMSRPEDDHVETDEDNKVSNQLIEDSLSELDEEFRNIIIFREIQELSYEEISKILKIPLGTVKSRINRGRLKLRDILRNKGVKRY